MIGSFANGATASLVAKNGTKELATTIQKIQKSKIFPESPKITKIQKIQNWN